jgi:hypothetical protein
MTESNDELAKSLEDLRAEVRELREMVNMLVDIIVSMESDDGPEFENDFFNLHKLDNESRFSM